MVPSPNPIGALLHPNGLGWEPDQAFSYRLFDRVVFTLPWLMPCIPLMFNYHMYCSFRCHKSVHSNHASAVPVHRGFRQFLGDKSARFFLSPLRGLDVNSGKLAFAHAQTIPLAALHSTCRPTRVLTILFGSRSSLSVWS